MKYKKVHDGAISGHYEYEVISGDEKYTIDRTCRSNNTEDFKIHGKGGVYYLCNMRNGKVVTEQYGNNRKDVEWRKGERRCVGHAHKGFDGKNRPYVSFDFCDGELVRYEDSLGRCFGDDMIYDRDGGTYVHYKDASDSVKKSFRQPPFRPDTVTQKEAEKAFKETMAEHLKDRDKLMSICRQTPRERPLFLRIASGMEVAKSFFSKENE